MTEPSFDDMMKAASLDFNKLKKNKGGELVRKVPGSEVQAPHTYAKSPPTHYKQKGNNLYLKGFPRGGSVDTDKWIDKIFLVEKITTDAEGGERVLTQYMGLHFPRYGDVYYRNTSAATYKLWSQGGGSTGRRFAYWSERKNWTSL